MWGDMVAGRYQVGERTFSGKSWSSYLSMDTHLGAEVELDIISGPATGLPVSLERFREILRAAQGLRGPHVIPLLDWGEEEGYLYLVRGKGMGTPLPEIISQSGALPAPQVLDLVSAAVAVLAEAYGAGLYYLGLNPGQVIIDPRGHPRFQRVGYGWILEDMDPSQAARVSPYRAPEAERGDKGTRASDVFSLAVMMNQLLPEDSRTERLEHLLRRASDPLPGSRPSSPRLLLEELEYALSLSSSEGALSSGDEGFIPSGESGYVRRKAVEHANPQADEWSLEGIPRAMIPKGRLWGWARKLALMLAGGLVLWVLFSALSGFLGAGKDHGNGDGEKAAEAGVQVPDLQGLSLQEARERLEALGLAWSVREAPSRLWSAGRVVAQEPAAGSWLRIGDEVSLVVSSGREGADTVLGEAEKAPGEQDPPADTEGQGNASPTPTPSTSPSAFTSGGGSAAPSHAPRAVARLSVARGPAPLYVRMDAGGSSDPDGDIARYVWRCGDGTVLQGREVQHVYDPPVIPARFQVVLEVFDSRGMSDRTSVMVEVY
ncbi:MAG: PASTA domain-containing protein [Actinomycetota bacterium]